MTNYNAAIFKNYKVVFYSLPRLIEDMILAEDQRSFDRWLKTVLKNDLLIIDELGYLPLKPVYANLFFQLVNQCYEYRSLLITSNKLFSEWGAYFGNQTIAAAILDRLLHHAEAVVLNGDSYRLKDKLDSHGLGAGATGVKPGKESLAGQYENFFRGLANAGSRRRPELASPLNGDRIVIR